jgi:hypothetical protein
MLIVKVKKFGVGWCIPHEITADKTEKLKISSTALPDIYHLPEKNAKNICCLATSINQSIALHSIRLLESMT